MRAWHAGRLHRRVRHRSLYRPRRLLRADPRLPDDDHDYRHDHDHHHHHVHHHDDVHVDHLHDAIHLHHDVLDGHDVPDDHIHLPHHHVHVHHDVLHDHDLLDLHHDVVHDGDHRPAPRSLRRRVRQRDHRYRMWRGLRRRRPGRRHLSPQPARGHPRLHAGLPPPGLHPLH